MNTRIAYCISDHTGVTVQALAKSVLSQFPDVECSRIVLPFVDNEDKARATALRIAATPGALIFSTLTAPELRDLLRASGAPLFDAFELVSPAVGQALDQTAVPRPGHTHGMTPDYDRRMNALNFSLALDDGLRPEKLAQADLVLVGVSRAGKTPTALVLALQYGVAAANYPLTPDDLERGSLPDCLLAVMPRLRALTLDPVRLAAIREMRYPGSRYASTEQCCAEIAAAMALYVRHGLPVLNVTFMSVEEIAARLHQTLR